MSEQSHQSELETLFKRFQTGDPSARTELLARLYDRVVRLTATVMRDFPIVRQRRAVESVANDLTIKLISDLDERLRSQTADEFLRYAGMCLRHLLIDEAEKYRRRQRLVPIQPPPRKDESSIRLEAGNISHDPASLAILTEDWAVLLKKIDDLEENEQFVVEQRLLWDVNQAHIAGARGWTAKQVSRLWLSAMRKLLPDPGKSE